MKLSISEYRVYVKDPRNPRKDLLDENGNKIPLFPWMREIMLDGVSVAYTKVGRESPINFHEPPSKIPQALRDHIVKWVVAEMGKAEDVGVGQPLDPRETEGIDGDDL